MRKEQSAFGRLVAAAFKGSALETELQVQVDRKADEEKRGFSTLRRKNAQLNGSRKLLKASRLTREGRHGEAKKVLDTLQ